MKIQNLGLNSVKPGTGYYAHKEEEFNERWEAMQTRYTDYYGWHMDYLEFDIINLHRQKVVKCFTSQVQHFGNTSTSRAEGQHAKLKNLVSSLSSFWESIISFSMLTITSGDMESFVDIIRKVLT